MAQRRKQFVLTPQYHALETRLALSGNFLSHGFADISREFKPARASSFRRALDDED